MAGDLATERYWRTPLDHDKVQRTTGHIHILAERCKGCEYCVEYCPLDVLRMSTRFNLKGYHPPEIAEKEACVACHLCETMCPEFAIFVTEDNGNNTQKLDPAEDLPVKCSEDAQYAGPIGRGEFHR